MSFPIGIHPDSLPLSSSYMENVFKRKQEYMTAVEQLFFDIFETEENVRQAVADNRILRIKRTNWNPIEEEIWLDNQKVAEFKIVGENQ